MNSLNQIPTALLLTIPCNEKALGFSDSLADGFALEKGVQKAAFYELLQGSDWTCTKAQFKALQECLNKDGMFIVRDLADNKPVGMACLLDLPDENSGEIAWLMVKSDYRKRGLGSALVAVCLCACADTGKKSAYVRLEKNNWRAFSFYRKLGFQPA